MPRYIDAEKEIEEIESVLDEKREEGFGEDDPAFYTLMRFAKKLRNAPTADVAPVVHGHWSLDEQEKAHCSACGIKRDARTQIGWNYCPHCGAKMEE